MRKVLIPILFALFSIILSLPINLYLSTKFDGVVEWFVMILVSGTLFAFGEVLAGGSIKSRNLCQSFLATFEFLFVLDLLFPIFIAVTSVIKNVKVVISQFPTVYNVGGGIFLVVFSIVLGVILAIIVIDTALNVDVEGFAMKNCDRRETL